jgi:hypothetical protein
MDRLDQETIGWPIDFYEAVEREMEESGCDKDTAFNRCIKKYPGLYELVNPNSDIYQMIFGMCEPPKTAKVESTVSPVTSKPPADFFSAVEQRMTETGCKIADAVLFCCKKYPEFHENMLRRYPYDKKIHQQMVKIRKSAVQDASH